jgi:hypothetical protein
MLVDDPPRHALHKLGMWNGVKILALWRRRNGVLIP